MTDPQLDDLLQHIVDSAGDAVEFAKDMDLERFRSDRKTQQAVVFSLQIVGEASAQIMKKYPDFVSEAEEIPWLSMRGMRNRIVHGYFVIDFDVVWKTVVQDLPVLLESVKSRLLQRQS